MYESVVGADADNKSQHLISHDYWRLAHAQAKSDKSQFMAAWVGFEISLKNALVDVRAKRLGKDANLYKHLVELDSGEVSSEIISVENVQNPLVEDEVVEHLRWKWILEHDSWFSFSNDEILAYGVKLLALHRWYRLRNAAPVASNVFVAPVQ